MRHYTFAIARVSCCAGEFEAGRAEAAPIAAPGGMRAAADALSTTEKVRVYVYLGKTTAGMTVAGTAPAVGTVTPGATRPRLGRRIRLARLGTATVGPGPGVAAIGTAAGTRIAAATIMEGSMADITTKGTWRRPPSWGT